MDTVKFVLYNTCFGGHTDVYRNGEIVPGVWKADATPRVDGGYNVTLEFIDGPIETFEAESLEIDDSAIQP